MSSNREFHEVLLRTKNDTGTADPAEWTWLEPDSLRLTVGGTTSDGVYSITITPVSPPSGVTSFVATFTRGAGETDAQIATELYNDLVTLLAVTADGAPRGSVLSDYVSAVSDDGAGEITIEWNPDAPCKCSVTLVDPGTATITPSPDDSLWPISRRYLGHVPVQVASTSIEVTIIPIDSGGDTLDPNGATVTMTCYRVIETPPANPSASHTFQGVSTQVQTGAVIGRGYPFNGNGGRFTIGVSTITGTITGLDALKIFIREVVQ